MKKIGIAAIIALVTTVLFGWWFKNYRTFKTAQVKTEGVPNELSKEEATLIEIKSYEEQMLRDLIELESSEERILLELIDSVAKCDGRLSIHKFELDKGFGILNKYVVICEGNVPELTDPYDLDKEWELGWDNVILNAIQHRTSPTQTNTIAIIWPKYEEKLNERILSTVLNHEFKTIRYYINHD